MMTPDRLAAELARRLDGPHADEHTTGAAHLAAQSVRFLNYATGPHSAVGLTFPATVYTIAGSLSAACAGLPQLCRQLSTWLGEQETVGMLGTDDGRPVAGVVVSTRLRLDAAASLATMLTAELSGAQNAMSGLNGRGPNRSGGVL